MEPPDLSVENVPKEHGTPQTAHSAVNKPLLPSPIASLVSLVTATSSFSLRVGGFIGHLAINVSRIGTLSGVELGRAVLESVLLRAGQDVLDDGVGLETAESILDNTLSALHSTLTHSSFLISSGFRLGTAGLSVGLGLSQALCTAIDAVLGDTETSKAIAAIVVLVQREFRNPATGVERVSLNEILTGTLGLALLQKWCRERSEARLREDGAVEAVWDLVVVDPDDLLGEEDRQAPEAIEYDQDMLVDGGGLTQSSHRSSTNIVDQAVSKPVSRLEDEFRHQIGQHLQSGTSVRISAHSKTKSVITVEVDGTDGHVKPPLGYHLVALRQEHTASGPVRKYVFQSARQRTRKGSFNVDASRHPQLSGLEPRNDPQQAATRSEEPVEPPMIGEGNASIARSSEQTDAVLVVLEETEPTKANIRRPRSRIEDGGFHGIGPPGTSVVRPAASDAKGEDSPGRTSRRAAWKKSFLQRGTPYKNLVEFWSHPQSQRKFLPSEQRPRQQQHQRQDSGPPSMIQSPCGQEATSLRPSLDVERRPGSRESYRTRSIHRRAGSSIYTLHTNASDSCLVLHNSSAKATRECLAQSLSTTGLLAGQFPYAPFAKNIARFVRFASASYGSSFLRFTGAAMENEARVVERYGEHPEHRSFSSYARLPSSTVLLSSFVDSEGGTNMQGKTHTGLPLIHYICLDHESKAVVLTCRGTLGFEDILTDLTCDYEHLEWRGQTYEVHKGMLASARRLLVMHGSRLVATIRAALEEFDDYGLVLCGHSLGGGVTAILGLLMSQPCGSSSTSEHSTAYVTAAPTSYSTLHANAPHRHPSDEIALTLPPNRPIHVYAFGPAATMDPALAEASRGLITTIVNNADLVPALSLGNLRDIQAVSLAFKTDDSNAKGEIRRRVWQSLRRSFTETSGLGAAEALFSKEWTQADQHEEDDIWPWATLKSLRADMLADKLVPPGECFVVERRSVLQRLALVDASGGGSNGRTFKPASQIKVTHVKDVAKRFAEIRFEGSMFLDHLPARYEKILEALWLGVA